MISRLLAITISGFLSCAVFASNDVSDVGFTGNNDVLLMADNPRKDRRDDRQEDRDDKQDCRQEEGRIGDDKRECKQEDRGEGEGDEAEAEGEDKEEGAEA